MDVYKFINSKDIRNYLREINYVFNPVEAAWLVWQCYDATLEEKHKAWTEIIDTMPDCSIEPYDVFDGAESLHSFLKEYMKNENHLLEEFFKNEPHSKYSMHVFTTKYNYFCENGYYDFNTCFSNYAVEESCSSNIKFIEITKEKLEKPYSKIKVLMNPNKVIYSVDYSAPYDDEMRISAFAFIMVDFPLPFKKGDIVLNKNQYGYDEFLVFDCLNNQNIVCYRIENYGIIDNGIIDSVYFGYSAFAMNLERFNKGLPSDQSILYILSDYLKGKIQLDYLLSDYILNVFENVTTIFQNIRNVYFHSKGSKIKDGDDDLPF